MEGALCVNKAWNVVPGALSCPMNYTHPHFMSKCRFAHGCQRHCWDSEGCEVIVSVSWGVASDTSYLRTSNQGSLCPCALHLKHIACPSSSWTPISNSLLTHYFRQQYTPPLLYFQVSLVAQALKNPPAMRETWVQSLGWVSPLEEGMATHSSILAWTILLDRGARQATVHGTSKSWTWPNDEAHTALFFSITYLPISHSGHSL